MFKALILDADGVVLLNKERFSSKFSREYGVPIDKLSAFFQGEFQETLIGKKDLKDILKTTIPDWGVNHSVESLLEYWFSSEANLNWDLLELVKNLKSQGIKIYLATNNEHHRTAYLAKNLGLENIFDKIYSSALVGFKKPHKEFYEYIIQDSGYLPEELIFFDDDLENVMGAQKLKIKSHVYNDLETIKKALA